jgi:hypothetical protein
MTFIRCEKENIFSRKFCSKLPEFLKILMVVEDFLKYWSPLFCNVLKSFSECYLLKVTWIDRERNVKSYCNDASQVSNAFEIDIRGYKQCACEYGDELSGSINAGNFLTGCKTS